MGGVGSGGSGWGGVKMDGRERRIEVFVKIKKKKYYYFFWEGGGWLGWGGGGGGSGWM